MCGLPTAFCLLTGVEAQLARWFPLPNVGWPRAAEDPVVVEASTIWFGRARPRRRRDLFHVWLIDGVVFSMAMTHGWRVEVSMDSTVFNANVPVVGCCACSTPLPLPLDRFVVPLGILCWVHSMYLLLVAEVLGVSRVGSQWRFQPVGLLFKHCARDPCSSELSVH